MSQEGLGHNVIQRLRLEGWTILQRAAAAVIAFAIARWIGDHPDVFFAPIAAIISLNTDVGDRGFNALKLLLGVFTGIIIGELALLVIGNQIVALGVAALLAITIATMAGASRLTIAQAAASAVLTISVSSGSSGWERLIDALIGAGVALVFTQVLFTPNPLRLLHRAETEALTAIAQGLKDAASALDNADDQAGWAALTDLRRARDKQGDMYDVRQRSRRVTRHTLTRRGSSRPVVAENENAALLDLVCDGCIMTVRLSFNVDIQQRKQLAQPLHQLAQLLQGPAAAPAERGNRQQVVNEIPGLLTQLRDQDIASQPGTDTAVDVFRLLAYDLMRYAGVHADSAREVMERDALPAQVSDQAAQNSLMSNIRMRLKSATARLSRFWRPADKR